jgi:hypothetical protein
MNQETNQTGDPEAKPLHPATKALLLLKREINTYRRELPRLLAEGEEGRFVLVKGDQVIAVWDTFDDAYEAGRLLYGLDVFLAQPINPRDLTYVFPKELGFDEPA